MKTITRSRIYFPMAAMILTAALAIPAAAQQQVPFKGAFQGNDTVAPPRSLQAAREMARSSVNSHPSGFTNFNVTEPQERLIGRRPMETRSIPKLWARLDRGYDPMRGCRSA